MKYVPWLALAAYILYRHTWGRDEVDALRRRLAIAHRETNDWRAEAWQWKELAVSLDNPKDSAAMTEPPRVTILTEAAELITGDRNKTYGSPTENFANTAALWNVQIGHKLNIPLTAADVAQLMVQLKMARMIAQPKRDNYVDAAGYLACGWECEE